MSATPTTSKIWTGYFSKSGSPAIKIKLSGPVSPPKEYEAILDTGFTGFLSVPLSEAIALGLVLYGTTSISLADGSTYFRLTARGMAQVENEQRVGVVVLEPQSQELLLGMAFLRQFKRAILVSEIAVLLWPEELVASAAKEAQAKSDKQEPQIPSTP